MLRGIKGKFIMSLNDHPGVLEVYGGYYLKMVQTRYSVSAGKNQQVGELLITYFTTFK